MNLLAKLGLDTASVRFIASFANQDKWKNISLFRRKTLMLVCITSVISSITMYFLSSNISILIDVKLQYLQMASFFVLPMTFFVLQNLRVKYVLWENWILKFIWQNLVKLLN